MPKRREHQKPASIRCTTLQPEQHAYREGRNALEAVQEVHRLLNIGYTEVVDADLSGYFDTIPHAELMQCLARRVSDKALLHLVKLWLVAPAEESDRKGHVYRTTRNKDEGRGSPQGAPLSPLLANIYMRRFVLGWKTLGHQQKLEARIVNYADDFVICCRGTADEAMTVMRGMLLCQRAKTALADLLAQRLRTEVPAAVLEPALLPGSGMPAGSSPLAGGSAAGQRAPGRRDQSPARTGSTRAPSASQDCVPNR